MKTLPHDVLEYSLRSNMTMKDYTLHEMYGCYLEIMNRKGFQGIYYKMSKGSLDKRLKEFSAKEGSWLIRKGRGGNAKYHKWICHRSHMTRSQLCMTIKRMREWVLCRK